VFYKNNLLFFGILIFPVLLFSQFKVSGTVKVSGSPIEFANVILKNKGSEVVKGVITDQNGVFELNVGEGSYKLIISYLGYKKWEIDITINNNLSLDVITLEQDENKLQEVVINFRRPIIQRKSNRLVFNVSNSLLSSGFSAEEVLKNTPRIDPFSESLGIIGKSGVIVMINDRDSNLKGKELDAYLKSLRSENILRIEVITSPSAKFDASGNIGIVNIVLKKGVDLGFDGSVTSTYIQRTKPSFMPSTYLTFSNKKLSSSLSVLSSREKRIPDSTFDIEYMDFDRNTNLSREDNTELLESSLQLNYQLSKNSVIGVIANGSFVETDSQGTSIDLFSNDQGIYFSQNLPSVSAEKDKYFSISPYYDIQIDSLGKKLKFNYNYLFNKTDEKRDFNSESYNGNFETIESRSSALNLSNLNYQVRSVNVDLELPYDAFEIALGGKYTFLNNDSDLSIYNTTSGIRDLDTNQSNIFNYDERIIAAYATFESELGEAVFLETGIRYESATTDGNSITNGERFKNNFENFFPSVSLAYDPNDNNSYYFAYGKRIDRPVFYYVNPFRIYSDFYNYDQGNPRLQPSITHNIEFSYTLKNNFSIFAYGSFQKGVMDYLTIASEESLFVISRPENLYDQNTWGLDLSYTWSPIKNFSSYNSFSHYYNKAVSNFPGQTRNDFEGYGSSFFTNNTFVFDKKKNHRVFVRYFHNFPSVDGLYKIKKSSSLSLGTSLTLFNDKLNLNIQASDIFRKRVNDWTILYPNFTYRTRIYNDIRNFQISLTYNFGNEKSKSVDREIDDSDRDRL